MLYHGILLFLPLYVISLTSDFVNADDVVSNLAGYRMKTIAHRGASGFLPEHTREAAALAYGLGADYIEQDVVLSRDGIPVVLHDIYLETVTDVADVFPTRVRSDGRWYAIDFDLSELRQLRVVERFDPKTSQPVFPGRFPLGKGSFQIATLSEMIELIQGLNKSTQQNVGIYPELKQPAWHRANGFDLGKTVVAVLSEYGYRDKGDPVFLQCFESVELTRLRNDLDCQLQMIQLIANGPEWTSDGLHQIARYADGVGPSIDLVFTVDSKGRPLTSPLLQTAHDLGLAVHPYTLRKDQLPPFAKTFAELIQLCRDAHLDAVFTDFPLRATQTK